MRAACCLSMILLLVAALAARSAEVKLDERPAGAGEWGYRPGDDTTSPTNPPAFCWRPQSGVVSWELECARGGRFHEPEYRAVGIEFNVHCPPREFPPGEYAWRYRGVNGKGEHTNWSQVRRFSISANAVKMPMPPREELLGRIPKSHPRLFVRPEDVPRLRELAAGPMRDSYEALCRECDRLLKSPPRTEEPPLYPPQTVRLSEEWREIWWGNREYTIRALNGAATLAFTRLLGGNDQYGQLAKRILLDCAKWDPKGATGYRYNDEAGMPYAYYFSRTYSFVHDLLSEDERRLCQRVMQVRGEEMYRHLCPRHLWQPYASHSNRAWHFLGEVGIAFLGEIEQADQWVWFAMNVFYNVYPVWCDDDGGWHEGASYWSSYISRFTWWADVMRVAMGINAYDKPYFSQAGYYPMYLMPPGKVGGGFGDLTAPRIASQNMPLMSVLAAQAGNRYWQWYVEQTGGPEPAGGYVGFVRGSLPAVEAKRPDDLPTSRCFWGIGQAYLNSTILDAGQDVQVVFKSSPFGTQSHGYEANNSFLLWAYGQRLLIRSGYRDIYGSDHHRLWMWSTRSVNNITVDGIGQLPHSAESKGRIVAFRTTPAIDVVVGEAGDTYRVTPNEEYPDGRVLDRFTRAIVFAKPELVVVFDRLVARRAATYEYWLHALNQFAVEDQHRIEVRAGDVVCPVDFLVPHGLQFRQTDQYDPNPRPRIKLREWHLTATTAEKQKQIEFLVLLRPQRRGDRLPAETELSQVEGGYVLRATLSDGELLALLPTSDQSGFSAHGLECRGHIVVQRRDRTGRATETVELNQQ